LKDLECVSAFLTSENKSRKVERKKALTKKLDQQQWRQLRDSIKNRLEGLVSDKTMSKKFVKKLHQELTWWILFPQLKGSKPLNWNHIASSLTSF
jgi:hypothetical protein